MLHLGKSEYLASIIGYCVRCLITEVKVNRLSRELA